MRKRVEWEGKGGGGEERSESILPFLAHWGWGEASLVKLLSIYTDLSRSVSVFHLKW